MKPLTVLPSRPLFDHLANEKATQHGPSLRSGKLTAEKKKTSETLTERFRELAVIRFNRVCACCGMLHNSDYDLCGTENRCANRLWSFAKPVNKLFHILADALILEIMHIMSTVQLYELSIFRSIDHCLHTTLP